MGYRVEFVWKPTSFDRMRAALTQLDKDRTSISGGWLTSSLCV